MRCYVLGIITTIFLLVVSCTQDLPDVPKFEVQKYCKLNGKCIKINSSEEETFCNEMADGELLIDGVCEEEEQPSSSSVVPSSSSSVISSSSSSSTTQSSSSSEE